MLFTEPWEPIVTRRGDALGLRALADRLGDVVAPDFSNRITDGRWVTILAWCLCRSHGVFHKTGRSNVTNRLVARERYAWLRPLELMWVARTLSLLEDEARGRPLAGQRRVSRWIDSELKPPRFAMTPDQFRAYRQTGMYGGYRLAFRRWPGLTRGGDGWTPGVACTALANWLDSRLGKARPEFDDDDVPPSKWSVWRGDEAGWWLKNWPNFTRGGQNFEDNTLPRRRTDARKLPEAQLLEPIVFGTEAAGKRRRLVVSLLSNSDAADHQEAVSYLAESMKDNEVVQLLPLFACLADAGMEVMDAISAMLSRKPVIKLSELAKHPEIQEHCQQLIAASEAWKKRNNRVAVRHLDTANKFAAAFPGTATRECLIALLEHHEQRGGGLKWFVLRNDEVVARTNPQGNSSRYRFRLWPLSRLATQCGVIRSMPSALALDGPEDASEEEEA